MGEIHTLTNSALAYLDGGSGSMAFQAIVAGLLAVSYSFKGLVFKVKSKLAAQRVSEKH